MHKLVKTLLLWLMLLALPLQGLAAVTPHCVPPLSSMHGVRHEHGAQQTAPDSHHHLPAKGGSTHDSCATACCVGALLPASLGLPALPAISQPVAERARHMTGIVHAPPQHPPQALSA
jgi:hypothetical protein